MNLYHPTVPGTNHSLPNLTLGQPKAPLKHWFCSEISCLVLKFRHSGNLWHVISMFVLHTPHWLTAVTGSGGQTGHKPINQGLWLWRMSRRSRKQRKELHPLVMDGGLSFQGPREARSSRHAEPGHCPPTSPSPAGRAGARAGPSLHREPHHCSAPCQSQHGRSAQHTWAWAVSGLTTLSLPRPALPGIFPVLRAVNLNKAQTTQGLLASGYKNNSPIQQYLIDYFR